MNKLTGRSAFEVDESFVFEHIGKSIDEEERELLSTFIDQSQQQMKENEVEAKSYGFVNKAYYRLRGIPRRLCDDSSLEDIIVPERISTRKGSTFGHKGKLIETDGKRRTKLTKVYKRGDNRGALLNALKRMKLNI